MPARPFLAPGIRRVQSETISMLKKAGELAFSNGPAAVERQLHRIGLINQAAVRAVITEGIPPPLAPRTIAGRINRLKGGKRRAKIRGEIAGGLAESRQLGVDGAFTPLIVTAQFLKSITYVLRKVGAKSRGLPK